MASSNLLKEAIADAKAVRETAIANAKLALEEAFTPRLQSMLSNKIEEELEENEELEEQSDTSGIGAGDNKVNLASGDDTEKNAETEKETADYGSEDENVKVVDKLMEADEDEKSEEDEKDEMMKEADMDMDKDEDGDVTINIDADGDEDDDDMDMELEAIIKELEEEDEDNEGEHDEMKEMEDEKKEMEDEKDEMKEMEKSEMEKEKSEMDHEKSEEDEKDEMMKEEEDLNIESILAALKEEDEDNEGAHDEETEMYKEQLEEAYDTIRSLKSTLNEVNLLNAKLLFSNKLFKSQNLTESQKMRVIETFDRAHSLREVKLVYTTLAESLKTPVSKTKKLRTEGLASKAQTTTKPKQVISEGNEMASRMKKLAGLL